MMRATIWRHIKWWWLILSGIILLFVPLLKEYHLESAILFSLAGCFLAANVALKSPARGFREMIVIQFGLFIASVPILISSLITGCFSVDGLGFWVFYPPVSVFLGFSIGKFVRKQSLKHPYIITNGVIFIISALLPLIELRIHPQIFLFNHIWGGWPGPIYDEAASFTYTNIYFRFITMLWGFLLWFMADKTSVWYKNKFLVLSSIALILSYTQIQNLGVISTRPFIQKSLGSARATDHFILYYDTKAYSKQEIDRLAYWHEFHFYELIQVLDVKWPSGRKIESYLYAHPWQKDRYTGAKYTSYVPVWNKSDQMHIAKDAVDDILRHEMVHVISKQFAMPIIGASLSIGLTEGLAVALEGPGSSSVLADQIIASSGFRPELQDIKHLFSLFGFYTQRPAVSYNTAGSFVSYLINNHPIEKLKQAYRKSDLECGYENLDEIHSSWLNFISEIDYDRQDSLASRVIFSRESIFERPCPRLVSQNQKDYESYLLLKTDGNIEKALTYLQRLKEREPQSINIWLFWSYEQIKLGNYDAVIDDYQNLPNHPLVSIRTADAYFMTGMIDQAESIINETRNVYVADTTSTLMSDRLRVRNRITWSDVTSLIYGSDEMSTHLNDPFLYELWVRRTQETGEYNIVSIPEYLDKYRVERLPLYLMGTQYATLSGEGGAALRFLKILKEQLPREIDHQRVDQHINWVYFVMSTNNLN